MPKTWPPVANAVRDGQTPKCVTAEAGGDRLARSPTELRACLPS
mgnify:CR=1 FL=1